MADNERRAEIEATVEAAMPEMASRFMWAASTGNHPDATAEGAVRTILEPLLGRVRDARGDDEACTCGASFGHVLGCPAGPSARSPQAEDHEPRPHEFVAGGPRGSCKVCAWSQRAAHHQAQGPA